MSVDISRLEGGQLAQVTLNGGKGNILDTAAIGQLQAALASLAQEPNLRCVILAAAGPHFSFGASVQEHRAESVGAMLPTFHALLKTVLEYPVPVWAAVSGSCFGGGLELALAAHRIIAAPTARFAQPEIKLGVFAPAASALLPARVGQAEAERLLLTGCTVDAVEAQRLGLVDDVCPADEMPQNAAARLAKPLCELSASSLRFAVLAARKDFTRAALARLRELERTYLDELMATPDASEGITAFLEKRPPVWNTERPRR